MPLVAQIVRTRICARRLASLQSGSRQFLECYAQRDYSLFLQRLGEATHSYRLVVRRLCGQGLAYP